MTDDTTPPGDGSDEAHWQQETITKTMQRIESEMEALQREASGPQRAALRKGRELLDEFESTLRDAAAGEPPAESPPYEDADGVDVSEQRKRP